MNAGFQIELFQDGIHEALITLLNAAGSDAAAREALIELGRYLQEDGAWRGELKRVGWKGHDSAWAALTAFIKENRTRDPWWAILEFANGEDVSEEVQRFFI